LKIETNVFVISTLLIYSAPNPYVPVFVTVVTIAYFAISSQVAYHTNQVVNLINIL